MIADWNAATHQLSESAFLCNRVDRNEKKRPEDRYRPVKDSGVMEVAKHQMEDRLANEMMEKRGIEQLASMFTYNKKQRPVSPKKD